MKKYLAIFLVAALALLPVSCEEPEEEIVPEIKVPAASEAVFASGIKFEAGEASGQPAAEQTMQLQFTATDRWTAEVVETKASSWLSVEPSSGAAGDVTMTVTAKPNPLTEPRKATVTIKCGDKSESFDVEQEAAKPTVVEVTSITLDRTELAMEVGGSTFITATVKPDDATDKTIVWTSSDNSVVTVQEYKDVWMVTAVAEGIATITATCGSVSATCTVTVSKKIIHVTSITLDHTALNLATGASETLTATVKPDDATDKTYTWASTNSSMAEVDAAGKVTAKAVGTVTITATTTDGGLVAGCEVTVYNPVVPVESITLDHTELAMVVGGDTFITATVKPDDATYKKIEWTSSDNSVVTVKEYKDIWVVTAVAEGTATITATCGSVSATCVVTVSKKTIPVESITLNKTSLTLVEDDTFTLVATVGPDDATDKTVVWTSSDEAVAKVDNNGRVTAIAEGSATVTAACGAFSATCSIEVEKKYVFVESITLDKTELALTKGQTATLTATVNPADATDKTVRWTTSDASVATVDGGVVTALKSGRVTIAAWAGKCSATCQVTVTTPVTGITLSHTGITLAPKESITLDATVEPADADNRYVTWTSSNEDVAIVKDGIVDAKSEGTAIITATCGAFSATCLVKVEKNVIPVTSITLNIGGLKLVEGETFDLVATVKPDDATDKTVTWTSSDASVAMVDNNGHVTAISEGPAVIIATAGSQRATCAVLVIKPAVPVSSVTLSKSVLNLTKGDQTEIFATVNPSDATDKTVTWTSSDESVASVSGGVITAHKSGTATITATAGDKSATCAVTVTTPVSGINLDRSGVALTEGEFVTLTATVNPDDADDKTVSWATSNASVATVDNTGKVTAKAVGAAVITATCGAFSATCTVTVAKQVIPVTSITLNKTALNLTKGQTETLIATVSPADATDKTVTWTTSNEKIASVSNGTVTALYSGTVTITAIAGAQRATCTVTITTPVTGIALDSNSLELTEGDNATLVATVSPSDADDKTVRWSSSNTSVSTVDGSGSITAVAPGTATITASCSGFSATCNVTVVKRIIAVSSITLNKTSIELNRGQSETLVATVSPANADDKTVTWSSSKTSVATVDASGKVTAVGRGSATITATAGGKTATCEVEVKVPLESVSLDKTELELEVDGTYQFTVTLNPTDALVYEARWTSDNEEVATVNAGLVTAHKAGIAIVTLTANGKTASCTVTVGGGGSGTGATGDLDPTYDDPIN